MKHYTTLIQSIRSLTAATIVAGLLVVHISCGNTLPGDGAAPQYAVEFKNTAGLGLLEGGEGGVYQVRLQSKPAQDVTVEVVADAEQLKVSPPRLTFKPGNYSTFQSITVTAADDTLIEGDHSVEIEHLLLSDDDNYDGIQGGIINIPVTDNDSAGFFIFPAQTIHMNEDSSQRVYSVLLSHKPASDVVISVTNNKPGQLSVSPSELTFFSSNWDEPQTIILTPNDDLAIESDSTNRVTLTHSAFSSDNAFQAIEDKTLVVQLRDNDSILHVDSKATGAGTGSSWQSAYRSLQSALAAALPGQDIWVAAGTYYPSSTGDQSESFNLKDGVNLYGGFTGSETSLDQADPAVNETILSGDLNKDDYKAAYGDNSYHVVKATDLGLSGPVTFKGFAIQGGRTTGGDDGGGIYINNSDLRIEDMQIRFNYSADNGGGMAVYSSPFLVMQNVSFTGNTASTNGGALHLYIYNNPAEKLECHNCTFSNNSTEGNNGGAVNVNNSVSDGASGYTLFKDCTFTKNTAVEHGGAIRAADSSIKIEDSTFTGNLAVLNGGAIWARDSVQTMVSNSEFKQNEATGDGGGIYLDVQDHPGTGLDCSGCVFIDNRASRGGGFATVNSNEYGQHGATTFTNSTFTANRVDIAGTGNGGGLYSASVDFTVTDSTFNGNIAKSGGGMYTHYANWTVSSSTAPAAGEDYPCLFEGNQATASGSTTTDALGGGAIYTTNQYAYIDICQFKDNTAVDYGGSIDYKGIGQPDLLEITGSVFEGNSSNKRGGAIGYFGDATGEHELVIQQSTFTGNSSGEWGGAVLGQAETSGVNHLEITDSTFTGNTAVRGGAVAAGQDLNYTITGSTLTQNSVSDDGGALYTIEATGQISGSTFTQNSSVSDGGAIMAYTGSSTTKSMVITDSKLAFNTTQVQGGAVFSYKVHTEINRCYLTNNNAGNGGAVNFFGHNNTANDTAFKVYNSLLAGNTATGLGGAIFGDTHDSNDADLTITNSTIFNNVSQPGDGAIRVFSDIELFVLNSIVVRNNIVPEDPAYDGLNIQIVADTPLGSGYNRIYRGSVVEFSAANQFNVTDYDNQTTSPNAVIWNPDSDEELFVATAASLMALSDTSSGDFSPASSSFLIDKGWNSLMGGIGSTDLAGNMRLIDGDGIDSGVPLVSGSPLIDGINEEPDVGAFEFQGAN